MARLALALAAAAPLIFGSAPASALAITYDLDFEFSNATPPAGPTPWITITIDDAADSGGANSVRVTVSNVNLVGTEASTEISLNFDPGLDPTQLAFTAVSMSAVAAHTFTTGVDFFQADGDGKFDILLDLPPPPGSFAARFTAGETLVFDLTYTAPISASSFDYTSATAGVQGVFHAAAHVQGIGAGGLDSGWIGDSAPEPAAVALLLTGLTGVLARGRRRSA